MHIHPTLGHFGQHLVGIALFIQRLLQKLSNLMMPQLVSSIEENKAMTKCSCKKKRQSQTSKNTDRSDITRQQKKSCKSHAIQVPKMRSQIGALCSGLVDVMQTVPLRMLDFVDLMDRNVRQ